MGQWAHLVQYMKVVATTLYLLCKGLHGPEQVLFGASQCMAMHLEKDYNLCIRNLLELPEESAVFSMA